MGLEINRGWQLNNTHVAFQITVRSNGLHTKGGITQLQSSFLFCLLLQAEYGQASGQMLLKNLIVRKKGC